MVEKTWASRFMTKIVQKQQWGHSGFLTHEWPDFKKKVDKKPEWLALPKNPSELKVAKSWLEWISTSHLILIQSKTCRFFKMQIFSFSHVSMLINFLDLFFFHHHIFFTLECHWILITDSLLSLCIGVLIWTSWLLSILYWFWLNLKTFIELFITGIEISFYFYPVVD
jgi:hypothetical protein